ncbi:MAG: glycosyltransferase family A protein [Chloroflexi bacterium]|nr:glycosyltransferase family A protein [Chloroflexota bacterium]
MIVPVYNGERYLAEAIASVRRQAYAPLEIIIVDDGSTDGTATLIERLGSDIRTVHQANQGPAAARNRGLELVTGDLIAFIDADDLWPDDKLRLQLPVLHDDRTIQIVMGKVQRLWPTESDALTLAFEPRTPPWDELLLGCALVRRDIFEQIGFFDSTLRIGEDTDWFLRARKGGVAIAKIDQVTLFYRRHKESLTAGIDHTKTTIFPVLKRAVERHRQTGATPDTQRGDVSE